MDDVLGVSLTAEGEKITKDQFALSYDIKDLGNAKLILGIHVMTLNLTVEYVFQLETYI